jgi:DNA-binding winged helix-turn-helix (wHTH) protein
VRMAIGHWRADPVNVRAHRCERGSWTVSSRWRPTLSDVHLSPKAFDLLDILLASRARTVSKAELQQRLWPDTFVEEANLAGLVAEIRRALRDPASNLVFVRTVYAFGYRFVGEVTVVEGDLRSGSDRARLYLVSDHGEMMLMDGANVIGRAPDATIQIDSPGVSRHHARIVVADGRATLEDVESKRRFDVVELRASDCLRVDELFVVRPAKLWKDGEGFDVRALRRQCAPHLGPRSSPSLASHLK